MNYVTTAEKTATLRKIYKEKLGLSMKDISVKKGYSGSSINVLIKKEDLSDEIKDKIYNYANGYTDINYDEKCQEILSGANTYVFVSHTYNNGQTGTYWPTSSIYHDRSYL